jgi:hypothetical protein
MWGLGYGPLKPIAFRRLEMAKAAKQNGVDQSTVENSNLAPLPERKKPWEPPPDPELLQSEQEDEEEEEEEYEGVRVMWTRSYVAGLCIMQFGLKQGVTEEMANWVDARYGKENFGQSWGALVAAWHSIRAYSGQIPSDPPEPETEEDVKESIKELEEALAEERAKLAEMSEE